MSLEPFQTATARAAVRALSSPTGSRRFLVADEVGLGKTVVSRAVAEALGMDRPTPLNVVYFCSNLSIASQNLEKLKALKGAWPALDDRLSLVGRSAPPADAPFRIFCYTPDTSLPGWKRSNRTGRMAERQLIADLLQRVAPEFLRAMRTRDRARMLKAGPRARALWPHVSTQAVNPLEKPFVSAMRDLFDLRGRPLEAGLLRWLDRFDDPAEFVLRARSALSLAALRDPRTRPDLLILDEFHRYADLILPTRRVPVTPVEIEREKANALLSEALFGPEIATLLLSATPYRLTRADGEEVPGSRYGHLRGLVRFLFKGDTDGADHADDRLDAYLAALRPSDDRDTAMSAVLARKADLEAALASVMARTERATALEGELFTPQLEPTEVRADDLKVFRHFAKVASRSQARLHSWVQPLWNSVPYPAETLFRYAVARDFTSNLPSVTSATHRKDPAHPQLRALVSARAASATEPARAPIIDSQVLRLPWLPPTRPWWRLAAPWAEAAQGRPGKALLFSRFTGTPPAISALLSQGLLASAPGSGKGKPSSPFLKISAETPAPLLALFTPWPTLSLAITVVPEPDQTVAAVKRQARAAFRSWVEKTDGVSLDPSIKEDRKPWRLAFGLERRLSGALLSSGFRLNPGLRRLLDKIASQIGPIDRITPAEADALADWLLSAPGAVVGRTALRQDPTLAGQAKTWAPLMVFCWEQLRPYLGHRQFADVMRRRNEATRPYPEVLRRAIVDGGFEAVLDEHLAIMALIGEGGVVSHLRSSLISNPGWVTMRRRGRGAHRAPVHVALPFDGAAGKDVKGKPVTHRSTTVRGAFNGPFWPHVLATTSKGQEGLDFHVWCDRVIHWDLPRDPVDFEQREGRVARYGSLCVRRALAEHTESPPTPGASPFAHILAEARSRPQTGIGLQRWWCPPDSKPLRVAFVTPFSRSEAALQALQGDLMRYRLALGQPDPDQFGLFVRHFALEGSDVRRLALDLSAWSAQGNEETPADIEF